MNLLESIKDLEKTITPDQSDKKTYVLTKKLFYVLKRRRYFGYDAIIERIVAYIGDMCDALEFDKTPLVTLLESFKRHEDLMLYPSANYRDHFMHQFHVFVVGYIILHHIGIEKVTEILNETVEGVKGKKLSVKHTLRIWFLASVFHDSCYILPDFDSHVSKFLTEILESPDSSSGSEKFRFSVNLSWEQLAKKEVGFLRELSELSEHFNLKHRKHSSGKLTAELSRLMLNRDHGVLSALIMLQKMSHANRWGANTAYDIEKNTAALGIALHVDKSYAEARKLIAANEKGKLCFESYPIVFLLAACDFIQEWGRRSTKKSQKLGSPVFHSFCYEDQPQRRLACNLLYTPDSFSPGQVQPTREQLSEYAESLKRAFNIMSLDFVINYYHDASPNPNLKDLEQSDPIFDVNLRDSRIRDERNKCGGFYISLHDKDFYMVDFSRNPMSGKCDIGFGTNSVFKEEEEIDIEFGYGGISLDGKYVVKRINKAAAGLSYKSFVGAESKSA